MTKDKPSILFKNSSHKFEEVPWELDTLGRKDVADYLTPFLESIDQPFVISIDAPYGTGKSYFLENWCADLNNNGFRAVYFNAWETDFTSDPLIAFISAINQQLEKFISDNNSLAEQTTNKAWEKTKRLSSFLISEFAPLALKAIVRKALDEDGMETIEGIFDEDTEKDFAKGLGKQVEKLFKNQEVVETALIKFRETLQEAISELTSDLESEKKKLIIFVDELDRCRPTYAVEVLERIKHLFCVEGAVFVLGVDETQLANAMSSVYGANLDTDGYLRKFIDWRFVLPDPPALEYSKFLSEKFNLPSLQVFGGSGWYNNYEFLIISFDVFADAFGLTLRQKEQCFTEINMCLRTLGKGSSPLSVVLGFVVAVKAHGQYELSTIIDDLDAIKELSNTLNPLVTRVNELQNGTVWEGFEPSFIAWFISEKGGQKLQHKVSQLIEIVNANSRDGMHSDKNEQDRREMEFWVKCQKEYMSINTTFPKLSVSLVGSSNSRIVQAGTFLFPHNDE